jgi:hypothetical protein
MSEQCRQYKQCGNQATWEIDVVRPGPVDTHFETVYACDLCRDQVSRVRSISAKFKKI